MQSSDISLLKDRNTIAFYCSSVAWGGLEMNFVRYASWMQERGWKVVVFCVKNSRIEEEANRSTLRIVNVLRNRKYVDLMNAHRLKNLFQRENISLCWFRDTRDFSILGLTKKWSGSRFRLLYQQAMQFGVSKKDFFHTRRFQPVDAWISTLQFLADQVKSQTYVPAEKIHVIPLGVDANALRNQSVGKSACRLELMLPMDAAIIGIIGRLDPLKGQHVAIEALHHLHARGQKTHLLICGESTLHEGDDYEKELNAMVERYELGGFVHFRPYSKEVRKFYEAIDIFTLCSKGETFGTVTIEAMAFAKPIVGTQSSGTPEILQYGECGLLFEPGNATQLAEQLLKLLTSPEMAHRLGERAFSEFEKKYSKEISILKMEEEVSRLLISLN